MLSHFPLPPYMRPRSNSTNSTFVRLPDGAIVRLRDAHDDAPCLREMFYTLSTTSRYNYFCAGVPLNEVWAERVAQLGTANGCDSYALVAEAAGKVIGVARFDRNLAESSAEIGILIADAWQSRGLGAEMVARLRFEAARRGFTGFTATVLGENRRAMRLLRRAFPNMRAAFSSGQFELEMPFDGATALPQRRSTLPRLVALRHRHRGCQPGWEDPSSAAGTPIPA